MSKRFVDSNKWEDPWYLDLPQKYKLAWDFICTKCDPVGVWKPSAKMMAFCLGEEISLNDFFGLCGADRILVMENGNWWLRKFCSFQYGILREDSKSQTTQYYIRELKKHSLWIDYTKGIDSPKDQDKVLDKDKDRGVRGENVRNSLGYWSSMLDELWTSNVKAMHSGKDFDLAVKESFAYLIGDQSRLMNADEREFKQLVAKWLTNQRPNGMRVSKNPGKLG